MQELTPLITGLINSGLIEIAKRVQAIPLWSGETKKIRATAAVLSVVSTVLVALSSGNLPSDPTFTNIAQMVAGAAGSWIVSHMTYFAFFRQDNPQS